MEAGIDPRRSSTILIVDDTPANLRTLFEILQPLGHRVLSAGSGEEALRLADEVRPEVILLDVVMPRLDGLTTCRLLRARGSTDAAILFVSAQGSIEDRVVGLEAGGNDYIARPFDAAEVRARVRNHLEVVSLRRRLAERTRALERELAVTRAAQREAEARLAPALMGDSPAIEALRDWIDRVGPGDEPVLLRGPPGSGAEAVARRLHRRSACAEYPLIHVRCALLSGGVGDDLRDGDAARTSRSPLELAQGGTLFLEDVHLLPTTIQRALAARLEASEPGFRLICASLAEPMFAKGPLAEALRGHAVQARQLPALIDRLPDLPVLASTWLTRAARQLGRPARRLSEASLERMRVHPWPGNLDELQGLVERVALDATSEVVDVPEAIEAGGMPLGSYQLVECLARGGMGEIWLARHRLLARPAAVKRIRTDLPDDPERRRQTLIRFHREATATATLRSPHTVSLYDFGAAPDGTLYYVMEYLEGASLHDLLTAFGPMPAPRVIHLLEQVCDSLAEAHQAGLVHQDIKPANLMICTLGVRPDVLKVVDFGVVKRGRSLSHDPASASVFICGTPGFIGPEVARRGWSMDHRADIYALGCVAWYALSGRPVFEEADPVQLVARHIRDPVPRMPGEAGVPPELERIVRRCLSKKPEDRPRSASIIGAELRALARRYPWTVEDATAWWSTHPVKRRSSAQFESTWGFEAR